MPCHCSLQVTFDSQSAAEVTKVSGGVNFDGWGIKVSGSFATADSLERTRTGMQAIYLAKAWHTGDETATGFGSLELSSLAATQLRSATNQALLDQWHVRWGTHVLVGFRYGASYSQRISMSFDKSSTSSKLQAGLKGSYNGMAVSVEAFVDYAKDSQTSGISASFSGSKGWWGLKGMEPTCPSARFSLTDPESIKNMADALNDCWTRRDTGLGGLMTVVLYPISELDSYKVTILSSTVTLSPSLPDDLIKALARAQYFLPAVIDGWQASTYVRDRSSIANTVPGMRNPNVYKSSLDALEQLRSTVQKWAPSCADIGCVDLEAALAKWSDTILTPLKRNFLWMSDGSCIEKQSAAVIKYGQLGFFEEPTPNPCSRWGYIQSYQYRTNLAANEAWHFVRCCVIAPAGRVDERGRVQKVETQKSPEVIWDQASALSPVAGEERRVDCGPGAYLQQFRLLTSSPVPLAGVPVPVPVPVAGKYKYQWKYDCVQGPVGTCYLRETPWNDAGNDYMAYLDRHFWECQDGERMSGFWINHFPKGEEGEANCPPGLTNGCLQMKYTCCQQV